MITVYSNNPKIRKAQRVNDRAMLALIKRKIRDDWQPSVPVKRRYANLFLLSVAQHNALTRLKHRGLIRYMRQGFLGGFVPTAAGWASR